LHTKFAVSKNILCPEKNLFPLLWRILAEVPLERCWHDVLMLAKTAFFPIHYISLPTIWR